MLLKLDLEKAFDKLEWSFIHNTLVSLNFPNAIIRLIMSCITTTSTSIFINGSHIEYFTSTRGIRQGDPLSPYLFIPCLEMLSRSINSAVDYNKWMPLRISKRGPQISHLFFADDIILTSQITPNTCQPFVNTLNQFIHQTGQTINFEKSKLYFSNNCQPSLRQVVLQLFQNEGR